MGLVTEDARIVHELEQFVSGMRDLAPILAETRDILIENGYSREEAVEGSFRVLEVVLTDMRSDA